MKFRLRDLSIRRKLIGIIMLTCAITLTLASAAFIIDQIIGEPRKLVDNLTTLVPSLAATAPRP